MKFQKEFSYCIIFLVILILIYMVYAFTKNVGIQLYLSILSIIGGSSMVVLGFWSADFAFAEVSSQLHQENVKGKFRGQKGKVYVPFMKNYTPLEWWNLSWFTTLMGVGLVALGTLTLGIVFGVYLF